LDAASAHVLAETPQGHPLGTGRSTPEGRIGRMAVLAPWRGRGVGPAILRRPLARARPAGRADLVLHAQVTAIGSYLAHGFSAFDKPLVAAGIYARHFGSSLSQQLSNLATNRL